MSARVWASRLATPEASTGQRRLGWDQLRLDDEPFPRREFRVAGGERQLRVRRVVDDVRVLGMHDELVGDRVRVGADHARGDDLVTRVQLIQVEERLAVRGAVAGDRGVADLTRQGRAGVVAGSLLQVLAAGALHEDLVHADLRDLDRPDPVAGRGNDGRLGRRAVVDGVASVVDVVVVVAIVRLNSARMSSWARAVTRPVPHSWKATNRRMSSPTVTKSRPKAAIARRIPTAGYRCRAGALTAVTVRWSTGTLRRLSRPVPCALKGDPSRSQPRHQPAIGGVSARSARACRRGPGRRHRRGRAVHGTQRAGAKRRASGSARAAGGAIGLGIGARPRPDAGPPRGTSFGRHGRAPNVRLRRSHRDGERAVRNSRGRPRP